MIGKSAELKLVKSNKTFREQAEVSRIVTSSKHQVIAADEYWKESRVTTLTPSDISASKSGSRPEKRPSIPTCCHQSVQQRIYTASESPIRSNSGRGILCRLAIGVGSFMEEDWNQWNFGRAPQSFLDIVRCICEIGCRTLWCGCWDVRLLVLDAETFAKTCQITRTVAVKYWYDFAGMRQNISEVLWV